MIVGIKINNDVHKVEHLTVNSIFTGDAGNVVLHFASEVPFRDLLKLSLKYRWQLYRYPNDSHVGLTVNENDIFSVNY